MGPVQVLEGSVLPPPCHYVIRLKLCLWSACVSEKFILLKLVGLLAVWGLWRGTWIPSSPSVPMAAAPSPMFWFLSCQQLGRSL